MQAMFSVASVVASGKLLRTICPPASVTRFPYSPIVDRAHRHPPPHAKGRLVTTATEPLPEAAPTKPPKLNSAAFKAVPEPRELRDTVRAAVQAFVKTVDKSKPLTKDGTREMAEILLRSLGLGEQYLGF